jgi:hypothetical protein
VNTVQELTYVSQKLLNLPEEGSHDVIDHKNRKFTKKFRCIRADVEEDNYEAITVWISEDFQNVLITQKNKITTLLETPDYLEFLVGLPVYSYYRSYEERVGCILAIQGLEPGFAVIVEYLDDSTYRVILDTEVRFTYRPEDIYIPTEPNDLGVVRREILEGRNPFV